MTTNSKKMKWHGWGSLNKSFDTACRPNFTPFLEKHLNHILSSKKVKKPVDINSIKLPRSRLENSAIVKLIKQVKRDQTSHSHEDRITHAYGKSYRDLWRIRRGILSSVPDIIFYPESTDDIHMLFKCVDGENIRIIPFGGGSNIVGAVEALPYNDIRPIICVDLFRMNKITDIDLYSQTATIQPGMLGPELETELNKHNMTLGHFPDSFEFSTIGGWIATRSAGMLSDKYGKIEDMVISLEIITPSGQVETRTVPKSSNGIDLNHIIIGSEGCLGIITSATLKISHLPKKIFVGYLFPTFELGIEAMHNCTKNNVIPAMSRLSDPEKTQLSAAFKKKPSTFKKIVESAFKLYIQKIKKFDLEQSCIMLNCYEGSDMQEIKQQRKSIEAIYKKYDSICLGQGPGKSFNESKYDFPYLRDFVMDHQIIADVSETSTVWKNILPLYQHCKDKFQEAARPFNQPLFLSCHISHSYHTGASLYFTFAAKESQTPLIQYDALKAALEQAFIDKQATVSHHHAVGYEHKHWLKQEIGPTGKKILKGIKKSLDPMNIMNPEKII